MTLNNPTAYGLGSPQIDLASPPIIAQRNPGVGDKNYPLLTKWLNQATGNEYTLFGIPSGNALWQLTGGISNYPITPYVVGPSGQAGYQMIQSAVNAANAAGGGAVWIQPGTYTENLTLYPNIQLIGAVGFSDGGGPSSVIIIGTHIPPTSGVIVLRNVNLQSSTNIFSSTVAGSTHIIIGDAYIAVTDGYLFNLPNWTGIFELWDVNSFGGTNDGCINNIGGATVFAFEVGLGAGSTHTMITTGSVLIDSSEIICPVNMQTGTSANFAQTQFANTVTCSNNSTAIFDNCVFSTGSNASLTQSSSGAITLSECTINSSASPVIAGSGAGVLSLASITYLSSNTVAGTLTLSTSSELSVGGSIIASTSLNAGTTITAGTGITSTTGNITATAGEVIAGTILQAQGDTTGAASTVSISNVVNETLSTGAGTILMTGATAETNSGWLKIYNGTAVRYIPYWTTIT